MKNFLTIALAFIAMTAAAQSQEILLLEDWQFHLGTVSGNTKDWQEVTIPHDWAIAGPFNKDIDKQVVAIEQNGEKEATEKTGRSGSLPWIGEGTYRRNITIPEGYSSAELIFDGAMSEPHVWVNGKDVGYWAYGYNVFKLDITAATDGCKAGTYPLEVHLQNVEESSRWYPGAGIFRPVRLVLHKEKYLKTWGTFARTTMLTGISSDYRTAKSARVQVNSEVVAKDNKNLVVVQTLRDANGKVVAESSYPVNGLMDSDNTLIINNVKLWSPEQPALYTLTTTLKEGRKVWDVQEMKVGIREISYTAEGFKLNGEKRKFKGVCLHHDLGPLGVAFNKAAFRRQVRLLKDMGCDAIRTSHNTPAPWQMEICDEMGMMVMAESFDMWISPKCKNGYARFFDKVDNENVNADGKAWWERDITNLVLVNRNYASNVMYSIGNEIPEQGSHIGLKYSRLMQDLIHRLDGTRPCTQGMDRGEAPMYSGVWQEMDVPGFNYRLHVYEKGYEKSPKGFVLGSETASTISSRGVYKFPVEEVHGVAYPDGQISSYDLESCIWSNLPDDDWMWQDKKDWVIGEFVWTGFDYLGEPTPYDEYWPSRSSYFGIYDLAGLPKDRVYLYRTHWNTKEETLHVLPHWTWSGRKGKTTPVFVYTTYPEAELFVNGKSQGRLKKIDVSMEDYLANRVEEPMPWGGTSTFADPATPYGKNRLDRYRLRWMDVKYEPGEIKVVAYDKNGKEAATKVIRTAGKPHHIELIADRNQLNATPVDAEGKATDTPDLAFVTVRVVDKDGNLCPNANNQLNFSVKGAARFNSCCNGDATSTEVFVKPTMRAFNGELVVVVEAGKLAGEATLTVTGNGLKAGKTTLTIAKADDGHGLWLKTLSKQNAIVKIAGTKSPTLEVAQHELKEAWNGGAVTLLSEGKSGEDFKINIKKGTATISSPSDIGVLYGAYHLLRLQNSGENVNDTTLSESPAFALRILNHWDNLDATVERGYAGPSIFWQTSDDQPQLIKDYARANASVGINATVLNNVNASPKVLSREYLETVKGFADIMRPYGVRVYLSVNFASPMALGSTQTADPLEPTVQQWWKDKCSEIYSLIPDFGGFLVKANSEGQPGPNDYKRSHSEGANMLARALKPHGGIVMWRSFVYAANDPDRAKQAYQEFKPLDGEFDDNVIIQIKNGPVDFQPREPYSPLFGSLDQTKEMVEFQITQEYLGHSNHIAFLAPMWEEFYEYVKPESMVAVAGVANIGRSVSWCGNVMAQSNWYAFGRQSWNPALSSETIADEWVKQTLSPKTAAAEKTIVDLLMRSREAVVDYMMPIGLHHQFADNHHYGPGPWITHKNLRLDWQPPYYHKADSLGLGFDRTKATGTDAVSQYPAAFANLIGNVDTCPEQFLLWFHHVAWNHKLPKTNNYAAETLWNRLCHHFQRGVNEVRDMQKQWESVSDEIDPNTHAAITKKLDIQLKDAIWWKDGCLDYFQTFSKMAYPADVEPSQHNLDDLKKVLLGLGVYGCPSGELLDTWR